MRSAHRAVAATLALAAVVLGSSGGACRPWPPGATPTPAIQPARSTVDTSPPPHAAWERPSRLVVPAGMRPQIVDFADAETGYALFTGCQPQCAGALFVTFDGGQSWLERAFPAPPAANLQLYAIDRATVVLLAEPHGWYLSRDAGRTFAAQPAQPPEVLADAGAVQARCPTGGDCPAQVLRVDRTGARPVPTQPRLPGALRAAGLGGDGRMWAVAEAAGKVHTALSVDHGRSWRPLDPPLTPHDTDAVGLLVSADGRDAWLTAGGGTGFPEVWFFDGRNWTPVSLDMSFGRFRVSAAAAGDGALAIAGWRGFGYVALAGGPRWLQVSLPRQAGSVSRLADGTLVATGGPGDVWLGTGNGIERTWVRVTVEAA